MLTKLSQIKGGLVLRSDVDALQAWRAALDATGLSSKLSDGGEGELTIAEALAKIVANADINDATAPVNLETLKAAVDAINAKQIQDVVKVDLTAAYANSAFSVDVTGVDAGLKVAANNALPVYTTDGRVVYADNAGTTQLTLNLSTGAFSGTPYLMVDADADRDQSETEAGVTTYTALADDFTFKVFATGTFTFATLPANALLDNQEMKSLAYDQAIDSIVKKIATDEDIVHAISVLVGDTAVQTQITNITNDLYRFANIVGTSAVPESSEGAGDGVDAEVISATTPVYSKNKVDELFAAANSDNTTELNKKYEFANISTAPAVTAVAASASGFGEAGYTVGVSAAEAEATATKSTAVYSAAYVDVLINAAKKNVLETASAGVFAVDEKTYDFASITGLGDNTAIGSSGDVGYVAATTAETVTAATHVYSVAAADYIASVLQSNLDKVEAAAPKLTQLVGTPEVGTSGDPDYVAAEAISQSTQVYTKNAADAAIATAVATANATNLAYVQENADRIDAVEVACIPVIDEITVSGNEAVTSFTLSEIPNTVKVKMYINGMVYFEGDEFTVTRNTKTVAWGFTASDQEGHIEGTDGFTINGTLTSKVRFEYYTGTLVSRTIPASN